MNSSGHKEVRDGLSEMCRTNTWELNPKLPETKAYLIIFLNVLVFILLIFKKTWNNILIIMFWLLEGEYLEISIYMTQLTWPSEVFCKRSHVLWALKNVFLTFYFVLGYSWLTMLWWFQVNNRGTQPWIYMYPFSPRPCLLFRLPLNTEQSSVWYSIGPCGYPF